MLRPASVLEDMVWNIDIFTCVLVGSEFPCEGSFFHLFSILGYRRGIARVSPEIRELSCLVAAATVASL